VLNAGRPALLASLSFLLTINISPIFGDVLGAPQALALPTPVSLSLEGLTLGLAGGSGGIAPQPGLSPRHLG
jgi:hypothetical protein